MLKETFSRLYPHPELFKPPLVIDSSLQFCEETLPYFGNVKPLYTTENKKIREAVKHALFHK